MRFFHAYTVQTIMKRFFFIFTSELRTGTHCYLFSVFYSLSL